jgi:uncharacterized protein
VNVQRLDDPAAFLDAAMPLLLADEARHNLILGLAGTLRDDPSAYPDYRLWIAEDHGVVVGAALRTPPRHLVLSRPTTKSALEALAAAIDDELPGLVAGRPEAEGFAEQWSAKTGTRWRISRGQAVYALDRVCPVRSAPGKARDAVGADRRLLRDWWRAFAIEALDEDPPLEEVAHAIEHRLAVNAAGIVVWDDDDPVSFAAFGGATPNGIRIGPVYTPPELRGRGYASALVAWLSARLLTERRFCFLYTDLANPTPNKIYEQIGYERVCESAEIAFER